jgi:hypothetical protein
MEKPKKPELLVDLTEEEANEKRNATDRQMISRFKARAKSQSSAPKLKVERKEGKNVTLSYDGKDQVVTAIALMEAFGTTSPHFQNHMMCELLDAACIRNNGSILSQDDVNAVVAAMHGINPQDEVEAMLASQMVATNFAALRFMQQLKNSETVIQQDSSGNIVIKLLRTYTAQMEALQRYRGKGQQKMTVEHVHVHAGGQAIVGQVTHPEGGGVIKKTEEQPHAKENAHAPEQTMPSPNKKRKSVPIPRNA